MSQQYFEKHNQGVCRDPDTAESIVTAAAESSTSASNINNKEGENKENEEGDRNRNKRQSDTDSQDKPFEKTKIKTG